MLSGALQEPDGGLERRLESFADDLNQAVSSYLGLTVTIAVDGHEISFSLTETAGHAETSLRIPLPAIAGSEPGSTLVLYAATPGAFVDLSADLAWALGVNQADLLLDANLAVPMTSDVVSGLREHATINRAIGVLIEDGHTAELARAELRRRAARDGVTLTASAQRVLDDLTKPGALPPH
jgi:hypothetical protein